MADVANSEIRSLVWLRIRRHLDRRRRPFHPRPGLAVLRYWWDVVTPPSLRTRGRRRSRCCDRRWYSPTSIPTLLHPASLWLQQRTWRWRRPIVCHLINSTTSDVDAARDSSTVSVKRQAARGMVEGKAWRPREGGLQSLWDTAESNGGRWTGDNGGRA